MAGRFENLRKKVDVDKVADEQVRKSEWLDRCQAMNCICKPSAIRNGFQLCTFHHGKSEGEGFRNWNAISQVIREEKGLIKKVYSLYFKQSDFWTDDVQMAALKGWDFCPMFEGEFPNSYIERLQKRVEKLIDEKASSMIERGLI